jgi:hypothetical protein
MKRERKKISAMHTASDKKVMAYIGGFSFCGK